MIFHFNVHFSLKITGSLGTRIKCLPINVSRIIQKLPVSAFLTSDVVFGIMWLKGQTSKTSIIQ